MAQMITRGLTLEDVKVLQHHYRVVANRQPDDVDDDVRKAMVIRANAWTIIRASFGELTPT